jgi:hypothetical protein
MKILFIIFLTLLYSCGDDGFKKVETLGSFRILGAIADQPEVDPVTLTPVSVRLFISDVKGGGRTIQGSYQTCVDPGISLGAKASCDHDPSANPIDYDIDTSTDADLGAGNLFTGLTNPISVTVPATILIGRSNRDAKNGVGYLILFKFLVDGKEVTTFKRISATSRGVLNNNPTGSTILVNGIGITAFPQKSDKLIVTSSAPESYSVVLVDNSSETRTEEYQISWYVSKGTFDKPKSSLNESVEFEGPFSSDPSLVIALVRDERGGLDIVREVFP